MALTRLRGDGRVAWMVAVTAITGFCIVLVLGAFWQSSAVNGVSDDRLIRSVSYLEDPDSTMSITDAVASTAFTPARGVIARGYSTSTYWLRVVLAPNPTKEHWLLTIGVPNLDEVVLFERKVGQGWTSTTSGDRLSYNDRPLQSQQLGFLLAPDPDRTGLAPEPGQQDHTIYLRVRTTGTSAMLLNVAPERVIYSEQARSDLVNALFYGLMIAAMTIAVGLYVYAGDRILLWFVASQAMYTMMALSFAGYASVLLPTVPTHHLTSVFTLLSGLFNTLFHLKLLRRFNPARITQHMGKAVAVIQMAALLVNVIFDTTGSLAVGMVATTFFMLFLAVMSYTTRTAAHLSLRALRVIYTVHAMSILAWILPAIGFGPSRRLSVYAVLVQGVVSLVLLLSMLGFLAIRSRAAAQSAQEKLQALNLEAQVQAQSALAQRNLTWMLAHEVGTSLSIIRLAVAKEQLSPRNAARIDRAVSGLDQVMQHCLDADRIHAGKWQPTPVPCDLAAICSAALAQFETDRRKVSLQTPRQAPLRSDPDLVRLSIAHLIDNALKYAPPGTPVKLVLEPVPKGYRFTVQNRHAAGAPPDTKAVFAKFYRDDRVLAQRGSGLGLFIVREVVQALGGRVEMAVDDGLVTAWMELGDIV